MKYVISVLLLLSFLSCSKQQKQEQKEEYDPRIGESGLDRTKETMEYKMDTLSEEEYKLAATKYSNPLQPYPKEEKKQDYYAYDFADGSILKFKNYQSEDEEVSKEFERKGYILRKLDYIEEVNCRDFNCSARGLLVYLKTGDIDTIYAYPYFSPDQNYLISIDYDYAKPNRDEMGPSAVVLYKKERDRYKQYKFWAFNDYIVEEVVWLDNKTIAFKNYTTSSQHEPDLFDYHYFKMQLKQ